MKLLANEQSHFNPTDVEQLKTGNHFFLYKKFGSHLKNQSSSGCHFSVWAPHAKEVFVIGDFNHWKADNDPLKQRKDGSGIWEAYVAKAEKGNLYKYRITSEQNEEGEEKIDPYSWTNKLPPNAASKIWDLEYQWNDQDWLSQRKERHFKRAPLSVYEVHLGSWKQKKNNEFLTYREIAAKIVPYIKKMGFTHVELLPIMEHPFYASWGYQLLNFFAPTSRYGTPQDFMYLIDCLHQNDIGVILDWVPSHFPTDTYGLVDYDGSKLYECEGIHPDWSSAEFNLGCNGVVSFLISNALFWLDKYHIDGLRVDAVASMLYLDYSREKNQWKPNFYGGRENLQAVSFLRQLNNIIHEHYPDTHIIAEESTAWPAVSRPTVEGGLDFDMKWNMGWMHDTLKFFATQPKDRSKNLNDLTFSLQYAFHENFVLPLSHDEVVHGKSSLLGKMAGSDEEKFSNLKCLYGYMYAFPGKKLLFMGSEIAQWSEWNHDNELDWHLLEYKRHQGMQLWLTKLNHLYKEEEALYELDFDWSGFKWVDIDTTHKGIIGFMRKSCDNEEILVVYNFNNKKRRKYTIEIDIENL